MEAICLHLQGDVCLCQKLIGFSNKKTTRAHLLVVTWTVHNTLTDPMAGNPSCSSNQPLLWPQWSSTDPKAAAVSGFRCSVETSPPSNCSPCGSRGHSPGGRPFCGLSPSLQMRFLNQHWFVHLPTKHLTVSVVTKHLIPVHIDLPSTIPRQICSFFMAFFPVQRRMTQGNNDISRWFFQGFYRPQWSNYFFTFANSRLSCHKLLLSDEFHFNLLWWE